jgi:dTMP kinase
MSKELFLVIEGLDGSGKSTASKVLAEHLNNVNANSAKLGYEPFDPACGGDFIRQILEKKLSTYDPVTLALAFAANRMDHADRWINPWLNPLLNKPDNIYISDRGYLSSLVYQQTDSLNIERIMDLNSNARKPDFTFFFNVTNETCYARMKKRNKPVELYEENLETSRSKYFEAINFLREKRGENIIEIDANGTAENAVQQILDTLLL